MESAGFSIRLSFKEEVTPSTVVFPKVLSNFHLRVLINIVIELLCP